MPTSTRPAIARASTSQPSRRVVSRSAGSAGAAASQIVMMLTSLAYLPAIGLATAGTSVVGQAIGAGDRAWARHLGTSII
ncbi:MAG: MATE family efflux transporter, partial [Planctomycetia bacterium]